MNKEGKFGHHLDDWMIWDMSKNDILNWFATNSTSLTAGKIILILSLGIVVGMAIFLTYQVTYTGVVYSWKFNVSNLAILLITIVIMLMISSNIVISLGMVGALSIVRFRTAIKDARDTVFIFWSIVEGLCLGSQNFKLAFLSTLVIAMVLIFFSLIVKENRNYLLIIRGGATLLDQTRIDECIGGYAKKMKCRAMNRTDISTEMIYELKVKNGLDSEITYALQEIEGITSVNWLSETGENLG